jgi:hypothetical protein
VSGRSHMNHQHLCEMLGTGNLCSGNVAATNVLTSLGWDNCLATTTARRTTTFTPVPPSETC